MGYRLHEGHRHESRGREVPALLEDHGRGAMEFRWTLRPLLSRHYHRFPHP
jgi:hypothetical protein